MFVCVFLCVILRFEHSCRRTTEGKPSERGAHTRQKFLELRAQVEVRFELFEIEIGTSRGTLAKWEQDLEKSSQT